MTEQTPNPTSPLAWNHAVADIPAGGLKVERKGSPAELAAVTVALAVMSCDRLDASYRVRAISGGGYRLSGRVAAHVVQACVVTLEPVASDLDEAFDVEYWPPGLHDDAAAQEEIPALSAAEIEPIEHGEIDAGRIVYETLAASLDPYPRKGGAEFEPLPEAVVEPSGRASPFAVLAKLKPKE